LKLLINRYCCILLVIYIIGRWDLTLCLKG